MRVLRLIFTFLLLVNSASAADWIKASITVTNGTTNGMTITIKGSVRTWTNNVATPSSLILTNTTAAGSGTNLFNHFGTYRVSGVLMSRSTPTNFVFEGLDLTASVSAGWASITLTTNVTTPNYQVAVPFSVMDATNRTNVASLLVNDLGSYSTNTFPDGATIVSTLLRLGTNQTVTGSNTFSGTNLFSHISNTFYGTFNGIAGNITNGTFTNATLSSPRMTNAVNYGNAFSSPGSGLVSEEFGSGSTAAGANALAVGISAEAQSESSVAIGYLAVASSGLAISVGANSAASGSSSIAIGSDSISSTNSTIALGESAQSTHINSIAIGTGSATTASNQLVLGSSTVQHVYTPGRVEAILGITNGLFTGTNNFRGDVAYQVTNITSLANGNNANLDFAGKIYSRISGPTAVFSINGIAGGRDGRLLILQNISGYNVTIANDSGVDPVAANRILTGTASDVTFTNASQPIWLLYDPTQSRWILQNMVGSASVGLTAVSNVGGAFGIYDSNAGAVAQLRTILPGNGLTGATNGTNLILRFSNAIDIGTNTSFEIPNAAAPTTAVFGEIAGDNNAWAASRGAVQFYDGTANTFLVGTLASDTPSNGQVPKWNTGGTITWEDDTSGGGSVTFNSSQFNNVNSATNIAPGASITNFVGNRVDVTNGLFLSSSDVVTNQAFTLTTNRTVWLFGNIDTPDQILTLPANPPNDLTLNLTFVDSGGNATVVTNSTGLIYRRGITASTIVFGAAGNFASAWVLSKGTNWYVIDSELTDP